ncbi:Hypothetical protein PHPALM_9164 [Phytophthora palmivora]|uniref:Uncharacterized protein n=1 Tax=Phytophthora palmivora TaxID=4796 RepID=A0A2P4Y809_9STRA|nr:Hypothetical protein PHPALM_9164 [Phytophthora palmivora]
MTAGCGGEVNGSSSIATPTRAPPPHLQNVYLKKTVSFSPTKEPWMNQKILHCWSRIPTSQQTPKYLNVSSDMAE